MQHFWNHFWMQRSDFCYWAAARLSALHHMKCSQQEQTFPCFPSLSSHSVSVSVAGKASWHFKLRKPGATLQPTRRGGSDTERWPPSLEKDAVLLQQPLTTRGKSRFNFPVSCQWMGLELINVEESQTFGNRRKLQISSISTMKYYSSFLYKYSISIKAKCSFLCIREARNKFILGDTIPVSQVLFLWQPMFYCYDCTVFIHLMHFWENNFNSTLMNLTSQLAQETAVALNFNRKTEMEAPWHSMTLLKDIQKLAFGSDSSSVRCFT